MRKKKSGGGKKKEKTKTKRKEKENETENKQNEQKTFTDEATPTEGSRDYPPKNPNYFSMFRRCFFPFWFVGDLMAIWGNLSEGVI